MSRTAHHRAANRPGPWHSWRQRCAGNLNRLFAVYRSLDELLAYEVPSTAPIALKSARLRAKVVRDEAAALVNDTDGRAWE